MNVCVCTYETFHSTINLLDNRNSYLDLLL